ncbi:MAG: sulfite exporter TauE/SafE family protein [Alphaproteobacteria bacterium]|nr:sulfite exporter TauE/SafE family protein [Alphaproteobacteria bacterium]
MTHDILVGVLDAGLARCHAGLTTNGVLMGGLLVTGLVGGISHCAGMCGPFVLAQVTTRLETIPASHMREWHRLAGAALLPYHLGRTTTYTVLGAVGALVSGSLTSLPGWKWVAATLLMVAALVLLGHALPGLAKFVPKSAFWWSGRIESLARPLFSEPTGWRGYGLGVLLGFIPCGLVYAALAVATATGDPVSGAMAMMAFALGTVPTLVGVGVMSHVLASRWQSLAAQAAPLLLTANAGMLTVMAWRMVG